ncbi:beta-galactosidase [Paenibacillus pinistramenti]|uniref:beta-galactosidase n=1 Tax=Paenibacillus pinistramenti TaxID=1768003 RepID=UPI001EF00675|nr:beta-galactosidase [Paenibacillus pinistramenti]
MIRIGVDYYPEHWPQAYWEKDAALMKESGVNVVRLAEFAWSRMEPSEGHFQFDWLDEAIQVFKRYDIQVVLGIPTMTPPNWLTENYPDVLPVLAGQHLSSPGVRGHRCYNSRSMRAFSVRIANKLAGHYGNEEAVIGWQTDNEFSLHMCACDSCTEAFHNWLNKKYGTLERVNQEWGTAVWSGEFSAWSQIRLPKETSHRYFNPSFLLDYRRFQSESVAAFQQLLIDEIRAANPHQFITHNAWGAPVPLDHDLLFRNLDFASFDYYPNTSPDKTETNLYSGALSLDRTRGFKRQTGEAAGQQSGGNLLEAGGQAQTAGHPGFWIMEQLAGSPGSWMPVWRTPVPGFIRAFAWQSIARGADGVVFFRWRSGAAGAEQFWHGLMDHSGVPGRRLKEFAAFAGEANRLSSELFGKKVHHRTAILYSFESHTALDLQPQAEGMDYYENLKTIHRALTKLGIGTDVVDESADISQYDLVIAPSLFVLDQHLADKLQRFAEDGGTLVVTNRTGVKERNNQCIMAQLPGRLAETLGVVVEEYDALGHETAGMVSGLSGQSYRCMQWNDLLKVTTAEPVAWYSSEFYKGIPAVTRNNIGSGAAYYLGTQPEEAYYRELFTSLAEQLDLFHVPDLPLGMQISFRGEGPEKMMFVLNLSREAGKLTLPAGSFGLLSGRDRSGESEFTPYEVDIFHC